MKILLHVYPGPEIPACVINGRKHQWEAGVPYNVAEHLPATEGTGLGSYRKPDERPVNVDFIADAIIRELWWAGVVEVPVERTNYGNQVTDACMSAAIAKAKEELVKADAKTFEEYRKIQETRAIEGRPALVPVGRYGTVVKRLGIDLAKYGIKPVGAQTFEEQAHQGMEVAELKQQLSKMQEMVTKLLESKSEEKEPRKARA